MSEKERDSLWQIIAEARDAWPRVPEDCPTDELVHLIESNWLADHDRRIKAASWDECRQAMYDLIANDALDNHLAAINPYREEAQP